MGGSRGATDVLEEVVEALEAGLRALLSALAAATRAVSGKVTGVEVLHSADWGSLLTQVTVGFVGSLLASLVVTAGIPPVQHTAPTDAPTQPQTAAPFTTPSTPSPPGIEFEIAPGTETAPAIETTPATETAPATESGTSAPDTTGAIASRTLLFFTIFLVVLVPYRRRTRRE